MSSSWRESSVAGEALLVGTSFFVLAFIAVHMAREPGAITNVWFANAAAMAILATMPRSRWLLSLAAMVAANFSANWLLRGNALLSASFVPGNVIEVVIGAWLLQRFDLARLFDSGAGAYARTIVAAGMLPQLVGATIGAATLHAYGFAVFQSAWLSWYVDSTLGALAVLPLALALRNSRLGGIAAQLVTPASLAFLLLTLGTTFLAFSALPSPFVVSALPLVASVFFVAPSATFALCFAFVLLVCAGLDYRWFVRPSFAESGSWHEFFLYLPAAAAVVPAQLLALVVPRMRQLQADTDALTLVGSDTIAVFDQRGVFRGVNRAYELTFGRDRDLLIGRSIEECVDQPALARERFERARHGQPVRVRVERDSAVGPIVLDVRYEPVPDAAGRISRILLSAHDVTELVNLQRELERNVERLRAANEGMQNFVRIASHDMREPLNTISQFVSLVEADHAHELSPETRLYFGQIGGGARRMRTLLDDVLAFSRLDAQSDPELRPVSLELTVETVLSSLSARIADRGAQIEVIRPLPDVMGQESLLVLLVQNLISNGIKFTQPEQPPQVRVGARTDGDHVVLSITDKGIGIAASDHAVLFTPFKRLHTRRQYDGTGLGLSICRRIAQALGGSIELESELGVGTQLHVRLRRPTGSIS